MLDNFRTQRIAWDKANNKIYEKISASAGDSNGRKLEVQIMDGAIIKKLSGVSLSLAWRGKENKGLDAFTPIDLEQGLFEIYYTTEMLSNVGEIEGSLVLVDEVGRVESSTFPILINKTLVDDETVQSENSFTVLTEALIQLEKLKDEVGDGLGSGGVSTLEETMVFDGKNLPSGTNIATFKGGSQTNLVTLETQDAAMRMFLEAGGTVGSMGTETKSDFRIRTNYIDRAVFKGDTGYMGIGTNAPQEMLDISGKIRMREQTENSDDNDTVATKGFVDNNLSETKVDLINQFDEKVDNIISTPTEISKEEIIDARHGEKSLGTNIRKEKLKLNEVWEHIGMDMDIDGFSLKNIIKNGDFREGAANWTLSQYSVIAYTFSGGYINITESSRYPAIEQSVNIPKNHKMYIGFRIESPIQSNTGSMVFSDSAEIHEERFLINEGNNFYSFIGEYDRDVTNVLLRFRGIDFSNIKFGKIMIMDLTETFGVGNEWTVEEIDSHIEQEGGFIYDETTIIDVGVLNQTKIDDIGNLARLHTEDKSTLVNAINEVNAKEYQPEEPDTTLDLPSFVKVKQNAMEEELITSPNLKFGFQNDTHIVNRRKQVALKGISEFSDTHMLDFIALGGDVIDGNTPANGGKEAAMKLLRESVEVARKDLTTPLFIAKGNHDTNFHSYNEVGSNLDNTINDVEWNNIAVNHLGETVVRDSDNPNGGYYYKDFERHRTRVIIINTSDFFDEDGEPIQNTVTCDVRQKQFSWFCDEALDLSNKDSKSDWGVIIISHALLSESGMGAIYSENENGISSGENRAQFKGVLKAFKTGGTFAATTNAGYEFKLVSDVDFTAQGAMEFVVLLNGHSHIDHVIDSEGIVSISNNCTTSTRRTALPTTGGIYDEVAPSKGDGVDSMPARYNDPFPTNELVNTCFTIFEVDRENKQIIANRGGSGVTRNIPY